MADPQTGVGQYIGARKEALDTPVLLVDLDVLERNILKMRNTIIGEAGVGWRPHTKAMKNPDLWDHRYSGCQRDSWSKENRSPCQPL